MAPPGAGILSPAVESSRSPLEEDAVTLETTGQLAFSIMMSLVTGLPGVSLAQLKGTGVSQSLHSWASAMREQSSQDSCSEAVKR